MSREVMRRNAADNEYLHRDFHGALNCGLEYLRRQFGDAAVADYLRRFTLAYHAPLREQIATEGLSALERYFRDLYDREGGEVSMQRDDRQLVLEVRRCPAVSHLRSLGMTPSPVYHYTSSIVNRALCEGTPFEASLENYDPASGACTQRFVRRMP